MERDAFMARDQAVGNRHASMRNKHGFSLIECLIYGAITSLVSILLFSFFNNTITSLRLIADREYNFLAAWTAHQLLCKDIQMADCKSASWYSEPDITICRISNECIGWQLRKGSLYRLKGNYDFNAKQWLNKSSALVMQNVKHFKLELNKQENMITSVCYELDTAYDKQVKTVILENRRLN